MGPSQGEARGAELGEQIGSKLKSMFEDLVAEPVPRSSASCWRSSSASPASR